MDITIGLRELLVLRFREHRLIVNEDLPVKSKLSQHAYEEDDRVGWNEASILEIDRNSQYRK
jgi:hypothetical protein